MEFVDLYINNRDYAKSVRSLFDFINNVKVMKVDPYADKSIKTYLSKKSMHGVANFWPMNVIKYVDKKNPDVSWTVENMYNSIVENRDVYAFITAFGYLINNTKQLTMVKLDIAKTEVNIYSCNGWWEDHSSATLQDHLRNIKRSRELLSVYEEGVQKHREDCNRILAKVFSEAAQVKVLDSYGDKSVPDNLSISTIMRRGPK